MSPCAALFVGLAAFALASHASPARNTPARATIIHTFAGGADGAAPEAGLVDMGGTLYGTTYEGGGAGCDNGYGCGTIYSLDPKTGAERVVYSFCSQQKCADGQYPFAGLIAAHGMLYGTTNFGGSYGLGTAFALDPKTGKQKVLHSFGSGADGYTPSASLIELHGTLYGTTEAGGVGDCPGCGILYSLDPETGAEAVLYTFCSLRHCVDGANPESGLIDVQGMLYGTTFDGGSPHCTAGAGCGSVFAVDPKDGMEKVVYALCNRQACKDGVWPTAGLTYSNGMLYGTTTRGGVRRPHGGTVFAVDPKTGAETVLYSFCSREKCRDGMLPYAGLIESNGMLYGTTVYGGSNRGCYNQGCGTVFALDPATGAESVIYSFCARKDCSDGAMPEAGLIAVDGRLFGTTPFGGADGFGTVFAVTP